nr:hypothetical protein [Tanacetum cinerariifolium]
MQHPVDGRAWKKFDTKYPDFAKEPRNVRLGLAADGFNPFDNHSQAYSIWTVILRTYNLPPWLCMEESSFMLTLLIPDPKSPGKDIDVYLRPLIEDLKVLWDRKDIMHIEKNVLEAILNTLLMNDKSKDTVKARQDLQRLGIRSGLWLGQTKNEKCFKPQAAYSFTPENRKRFCQFIKGVKLPDGFGSCFKHKQICSATLMEDDMLKARIKVVDILCDLKLIYPLALFDIIIHLVIHLPLEALEGGPIRPRWMYPFERYMKKLKGYVRNKAKPEGSIAEGYVAEEALTFSSHYFQDVTTKFNRPDRNVDPPLPTLKWYALHNSPEINTYRSQFKSLFSNKDMKKEFPDWFGSQIRQRHIDNDKDPEVSTTSELFALACGPAWTPISINSCIVDGVRYVVHSRDEHRITQNIGICSPGPDGEMYYGQLHEILEFKYFLFKVVLFRVKWFDTRNKGRKVKRLVL